MDENVAANLLKMDIVTVYQQMITYLHTILEEIIQKYYKDLKLKLKTPTLLCNVCPMQQAV